MLQFGHDSHVFPKQIRIFSLFPDYRQCSKYWRCCPLTILSFFMRILRNWTGFLCMYNRITQYTSPFNMRDIHSNSIFVFEIYFWTSNWIPNKKMKEEKKWINQITQFGWTSQIIFDSHKFDEGIWTKKTARTSLQAF